MDRRKSYIYKVRYGYWPEPEVKGLGQETAPESFWEKAGMKPFLKPDTTKIERPFDIAPILVGVGAAALLVILLGSKKEYGIQKV